MRIFVLSLTGLLACTSPPVQGNAVTPAASVTDLGGIRTDVRGQCFARGADKTQVRVVDDMIEVAPETVDANGTVTAPAVYRRVTKPQTIVTGPGPQFQTVCPQQYTPKFVESLQRAMVVRQAYQGPISGEYDIATQDAVQQIQVSNGIDSALLSVDLARQLGVLSVPRDAT